MAAVLLLLAHARHGPLDTSPVEDPQLRSPLHLAAELAHVVITQLLLWVSERGTVKGSLRAPAGKQPRAGKPEILKETLEVGLVIPRSRRAGIGPWDAR